jgi:putative PepSY-like beta-lactamase-inhibitor
MASARGGGMCRPPRTRSPIAEETPMTLRRLGLVAVLFAFAFAAPVASADDKDKKLDLDKIPKKVMDAFKGKFPKAEIQKWTKEKEGDAEIYDIEAVENGRKCEADIKEDGTIMNFEKEVAAKDLPKAVVEAVEKKYPKATLKLCMECTEIKDKKEVLEGYEIELVTAEKKDVEVTVAPDGKILEDSTDKKEEKKDK